MIHQPLGGSPGTGDRHRDLDEGDPPHASGAERHPDAKHTGQPLEKIERDTDRNFFMSAEQAKDTASWTRSSLKLERVKEEKPEP